MFIYLLVKDQSCIKRNQYFQYKIHAISFVWLCKINKYPLNLLLFFVYTIIAFDNRLYIVIMFIFIFINIMYFFV